MKRLQTTASLESNRFNGTCDEDQNDLSELVSTCPMGTFARRFPLDEQVYPS
jgi:hypothetical protein